MNLRLPAAVTAVAVTLCAGVAVANEYAPAPGASAWRTGQDRPLRAPPRPDAAAVPQRGNLALVPEVAEIAPLVPSRRSQPVVPRSSVAREGYYYDEGAYVPSQIR